jgi:hypothetical protein
MSESIIIVCRASRKEVMPWGEYAASEKTCCADGVDDALFRENVCRIEEKPFDVGELKAMGVGLGLGGAAKSGLDPGIGDFDFAPNGRSRDQDDSN